TRDCRLRSVPLLPNGWPPFAKRFPRLPETASNCAGASSSSPGVIGGAMADGETAAGAIGAMAGTMAGGTIGGTTGERRLSLTGGSVPCYKRRAECRALAWAMSDQGRGFVSLRQKYVKIL